FLGPAPRDADALPEIHEVRRREQAGAHARRAQRALDQRAGRALAVRARHVHGAEAPLGVAERAQQRPRAVEAELGFAALESVERLEGALKCRVRHPPRSFVRPSAAAAGAAEAWGDGWPSAANPRVDRQKNASTR